MHKNIYKTAVLENVSRETFDTISDYIVELFLWNQKINLTSAYNNEENIWSHIFDSVELAQNIESGVNVIDIGSGNGLPAIILAILGFSVTAVELRGKRCSFLNYFAGKHALPLKVLNKNAIELDDIDIPEEGYCVTAKAVGSSDAIVELTARYKKKIECYMFAKNSNQISNELEELKKLYNVSIIKSCLSADKVFLKIGAK